MSNFQNIYTPEDLPDFETERETAHLSRRSVDQNNTAHRLELAYDGTNLLRNLVEFTKLQYHIREPRDK